MITKPKTILQIMRNKFTTLISILLLLLLFACNKTKEINTIGQNLKLEALAKLRSNLNNSKEWERVHAAEALINLNFKEEAYRIFIEEEKKNKKEYFHRIGIWRVLAQASVNDKEKKQWIDSISAIFKNPNNPDVTHAAESLSKLSFSTSNFSPKLTDSILNDEHNSLWSCTLWSTAYSPKKKQIKNQLVNILQQKEESVKSKTLAAYALRFLKNSGIQNREKMIKVLNKEPDTSATYPYLLSAILVNTPKDSLMTLRSLFYKKKLENIAKSNGHSGQYEALSALAEMGNATNIKLLVDILKGIDTTIIKNKIDISIATSYALLQIDRRLKLNGVQKK